MQHLNSYIYRNGQSVTDSNLSGIWRFAGPGQRKSYPGSILLRLPPQVFAGGPGVHAWKGGPKNYVPGATYFASFRSVAVRSVDEVMVSAQTVATAGSSFFISTA